MSATFAVKKKCCCEGTTPQYYQGFDCKDGGAALTVYTRTTNSPGDLYYRLGAYCVQFNDTPVNEDALPDDAIIVPGSSLSEFYETCEECTPGGCPDDNAGCGGAGLHVIINFPGDCVVGLDDLDVLLTSDGDGTWSYAGDGFDINLDCADGYWRLTYFNGGACVGVLTWTVPQVSDCPIDPDSDRPAQWDFDMDSLADCCTTAPTAVVYVPA